MKFSDLESFLTVAGKKGFLTQPVLKQTMAALEKMKTVQAEDPDHPEFDLTKEGIAEELFKRFMTIRPEELSPESANVYVARVKKAVENCAKFTQDPLSYKSTFSAGGAKSNSAPVAAGKDSTKKEKAKTKASAAPAAATPEASIDSFLASFPLRKDFMLAMHLPKDLNTTEVRRLAYYLLSLCEDFNPAGKSDIFYQAAPQQANAIENTN